MTTKIDKINKAIAKTNEAFKKATKAQKRVMIAKDVLTQLRSKRYVAESGIWVSPKYKFGDDGQDINRDESVQTLFADKTIEKCSVCALGGLFMSCTNMNNNTKVSDLEDEAEFDLGEIIDAGEKLSNGLNEIFSKSQLALIEKYFEGGDGYHSVYEGDRGYNAINDFYQKYTSNQRLKKIMENIVANDGTFVPSKLKVVKFD